MEKELKKVEPGINIRINQNGSNIQYTLKNICDLNGFHGSLYFYSH